MPGLKGFARTAAALVAAWLLPAQPAGKLLAPAAVMLIVEQSAGDSWHAVDPQTVFSAGDVIRFRFHASFGGYLYVLNQSSAGAYEWLFPSRIAGTQNQIVAGAAYLVPVTEGGFRVQGKPGFDILHWIVTPTPLGSFGSMTPADVVPTAPAKDGRAPGELLPRCRDDLLRARGRCVDERAGPRAPSETQVYGKAVAGAGGLRPRELTFQKTEGGTEISSAPAAGAPFIYEYRLAHR